MSNLVENPENYFNESQEVFIASVPERKVVSARTYVEKTITVIGSQTFS
jgi:hypothetical protein